MDLEALLSFKTIVVGAFLLVCLIYERVRPAVDDPLLVRFRGASAAAWRRLARNTGLFGINLLISPLIVVPVTVWAGQLTTGLRPAWLSGWTGLAFDLILLDFWIYWWHRANHEIPFLWRFHQVHHFDELLDSTSALRFHFGEVVLSALVRACVIIAIDIPVSSVLLFEALVLMSTIFHHSDARLPPRLERALARVIITPSIHWVHHHALRADTGFQLRHRLQLLGSAVPLEERTTRWPTMPIGVEGRRDRPLLRLIVTPFWR
jgi:sterol desaturase/sphingolipid hydroxylase (fatty acid hydroxylase superfamily)